MKVKEPAERHPTWREWLAGALLVLAVIVAYQQAWSAGYIWDDDMYVTRNPLLTAADGLRRIWFTFDAPSEYFPLTYTTFRLEHAIWGFNASGYHWTNVLLHAANAVLVWRLLSMLKVPAAWLGAAIWALHPVQVESVAWITERKNVLMGLFFLLSVIAWTRHVDGERRPHAFGWLGLSFFFYVVALSAKTTACTLPAALALVLWWQRRPFTWRRSVEIAAFVVAGVAAGMVSVMWERVHQGGRPDFIPIDFVERFLIGSRAVWFYLSKLLWPNELMFSYPRWDISRTHPADWIWPAALLGLIGAIAYARRFFGRGPEVAVAFLVATLSPLLGFVIVITFQYSFVADHYQYLACVGPLALAAAGLHIAAARLRIRHLETAVASVVLLLLGVLTWRQSAMYRNEETLWRRTIAQNPGSWMAHNNLAGYLLGQKRADEAIAEYRRLIELLPRNFLGYMNLGAALARKGDGDAAIAAYEQALALQPNDARIERNLAQSLAALHRLDDAVVHFERAIDLLRDRPDAVGRIAEIELELGNAIFEKGDSTDAMAHYRRALELRPDYPAARANLGSALSRDGRWTEAIEQYRAAIALQPDEPAPHNNLASALVQQRDLRGAIKEFRAAVAVAPDSPATLTNLAQLLATAPDETLRNGAQSLDLARRAVSLTRRRDVASLRALAAALAENGDFAEAERTADEALAISGQGNARIVEVLRIERERYRRGERAPLH